MRRTVSNIWILAEQCTKYFFFWKLNSPVFDKSHSFSLGKINDILWHTLIYVLCTFVVYVQYTQICWQIQTAESTHKHAAYIYVLCTSFRWCVSHCIYVRILVHFYLHVCVVLRSAYMHANQYILWNTINRAWKHNINICLI